MALPCLSMMVASDLIKECFFSKNLSKLSLVTSGHNLTLNTLSSRQDEIEETFMYLQMITWNP
jgi:hypothetical protein